MSSDLIPATFACAPIGRRLSHRLGPYHGYTRTGAPDQPYFAFEEAQRIIEDWKALPVPTQQEQQGTRYKAHYNSTDKAFRFYDAEKDAWHTWQGEDVGVALLYPIGRGAWKWDCRS